MSDAKWVKLLKLLTGTENLVLDCRAKLVWDETPRPFAIDGTKCYQFDFWPTAVEGLISGTQNGWHSYREIEWILFPRCSEQIKNQNNLKAGTETVHQDLAAIRAAIERIGQFDLESQDEFLRLYAYRRP